MVKRIRKRVAKNEAKKAEPDVPEDGDNEAASFNQQMDALAEDRLTSVLVSWTKGLVGNRGLVIVGTLLAVGAAVSFHLVEESKTKASTEAAESFDLAAKAYAKVVLPAAATGDKGKEASPEEKKTALEKARKDFESTESTYGDSMVRSLATLGRANADLDLGATKKALGHYAKIAGATSLARTTQVITLQGQAAAMENSGDAAGALKIWKSVGKMNQGALGLIAGMQEGRILESSGKKGEAVKVYETLKKTYAKDLANFANTPTRMQLERKLSMLGNGTKTATK